MAKVGSFRDPSGYVTVEGDEIRRIINPPYFDNYNLLMQSGLYDELKGKKLIIPHLELPRIDAHKVIMPDKVWFITYPYEWCFGQLKDTALKALGTQRMALNHGMILKDCSAYNWQLHEGNITLIDTLSFERYIEGQPWQAYGQFCRHFLAPLALMSHCDLRFGKLSSLFIDGIPLDLAVKILPRFSSFGRLFVHLRLHSSFVDKAATKKLEPKVSKNASLGMIESLEKAVLNLEPKEPSKSVMGQWAFYDELGSYSDIAKVHKMELVTNMIIKVASKTTWDLGSSYGAYTLPSSHFGKVLSLDSDYHCVDYVYCLRGQNITPIVADLFNPSPAIGWANQERMTLWERGHAQLILALALVHHLAIGNNVPLDMIAELFSRCGDWLIIEFVPKDDDRVKQMLLNREDVFSDYTEQGFEKAFAEFYSIEHKEQLRDSKRIVYLMRGK